MDIYAAVSIITIENNELLILKRAINPIDPWSGHLSLPGGRLEQEDATPLDAAIRETKEECGIKLFPEMLQYECEAEFAGPGSMKVIPYHFNLKEKPEILLETKEHSEFYWIHSDYLLDKKKHKSGYLSSDFPDRSFNYIDIGGTPLWGFTYKVLSKFLNWN